MKKFIYFVMFILISFSLCADWHSGDPAKWVQLPDPTGYDVNFTGPGNILADDWECTETNFINFVHLWVSFQEDNIPVGDPTYGIDYVHLSIHSDMPVGPYGYSQPDLLLWEKDILPADFTVIFYGEGLQGWYDPLTGVNFYPDHNNYYQINISCGLDAFQQQGDPTIPIVYWLDAYVVMKPDFEGYHIGWKSSLEHWNDIAVFFDGEWFPLNNEQLISPYDLYFDLAFVLVGGDCPLPVELSSFYGNYINGTPTLYWTTESEIDNAYWNVYRGTNNNFTEASHLNVNNPVAGNGTTNEISEYVYVDVIPVVQNTTYWYWIESVSEDGETEVQIPITLRIPFEDIPIIPDDFGLYQNFPNPFNPSTLISFALKEESDVKLIIYNVKGEKIKTIFNEHVNADEITSAVWNGKDANDKDVASGVYFYKLITNTKEYQKKMLLVK